MDGFLDFGGVRCCNDLGFQNSCFVLGSQPCFLLGFWWRHTHRELRRVGMKNWLLLVELWHKIPMQRTLANPPNLRGTLFVQVHGRLPAQTRRPPAAFRCCAQLASWILPQCDLLNRRTSNRESNSCNQALTFNVHWPAINSIASTRVGKGTEGKNGETNSFSSCVVGFEGQTAMSPLPNSDAQNCGTWTLACLSSRN